MRRIAGVLAATTLLLGGCATGAGETAGPPDLTPIPGRPLTPAARLVLACMDQARTAGGVDMIGDDGESRMIRFTCTGDVAQGLFEVLGPRSVEIGSEWVDGGVVHRSTERMQENLYGLDFCRRAGSTHACVFNLNLGAFVGE